MPILHVRQLDALPLWYRVERLGAGFVGERAPAPPADDDGVVSLALDLPPGEYCLRWYRSEGGPAIALVGAAVAADGTPRPPGTCGRPTARGSPCLRTGRCPYHP